MTRFRLECPPQDPRTTEVVVRRGCLADAAKMFVSLFPNSCYGPVAWISDNTVAALFGSVLEKSLAEARLTSTPHLLAPGENSKSFDSVQQIFERLESVPFPRDGLIVALGGGVISDVAGFVAATWMRGVRWAVIPTTLEAQIDACLGGKTGINLPGAKNLVGAFHPPSLIVADPDCLQSLDHRDVRAGLAESVKHALLDSEEFVSWHEVNADRLLALDGEVLEELVIRNLQFKASVVASDPYDRTGRRAVLNFGHTLGHALEECSDFALRHGEGVALGMVAACRISMELGILSQEVAHRVRSLLAHLVGPISWPPGIPTEALFQAMRRDKKVEANQVRMILLTDLGRPQVRADVPEALIRFVCENPGECTLIAR